MFRALPLLGLLAALHGAPAGAQGTCGDRNEMARRLVDQYGETLMGAGLGGPTLLEVWANCETGTWTILKTYTTGTACVMAAGTNWHGAGCEPGQPA